jgi:hypothetical protein
MSTERPDLAGVMLALHDARQAIGHAVLATHRREPLVAEAFLRVAQQRATAAQIDLAALDGQR